MSLKFQFVVACLACLFGHVNAAFNDSGFLEWFGDERREVDNVNINFSGRIPTYIKGYLVQAGPGLFSMGDYKFTHAFDGFAKVQRLVFGEDSVTFSSKFLESSFYKESVKHNKIVTSMLAGDTVPSQGFGPKGALAGHNDNNDVKCHKIGGTEAYLSDTPVASVFRDNFERLDHVIRPVAFGLETNGTRWHDDISPSAHICATGIMAHGKTNPLNGNFIGTVMCISPLDDLHPGDYHLVFEIDPAKPDERKLISSIKMEPGRKGSYMHSMAQTSNYVVLVAQPLHMSITAVMEGKGLADGAIELGNGTVFQAVNLTDGSVREWHHDGFLYAHIYNSWEEGDDIVMDLTWYVADWHMTFLGMFKFENLQKEKRESWPGNKLMRYRLKKDGTVEETNLLPAEPQSLFDLPVVDPRRHTKQKACVAWLIQGRSNAYDEEKNSTKVGPAGAYGLAKRNFCTGERTGWYAPNEYPSEVTFIPNPKGVDEDDGALVGVVYDANTNSSYVHIRDARSLELIARGDLPIRTPFLVHATWFPDSGYDSTVII